MIIFIFILALLFVLTYKPSSRTLDFFMPRPGCDATKYLQLQVGQENPLCELETGAKNGAIYEQQRYV